MGELDLNRILANTCNNPEDQEDYTKFQDHLIANPTKSATYRGWRIFEINLHCTVLRVVARSLGDGKYEVREWDLTHF